MSSVSGAQFEADSGPKDLATLRQVQSGDRAAFARIVTTYQDRLHNAVLRLVGDHEEARELTQETFTRALEKITSFRGESGAYTWLFRIALNLSVSRLRKTRRQRTFSLDAPGHNGNGRARGDDQAAGLIDRMAGDSPSPSADLERREAAEQVLAALGRIDADYRAVLVMRDVEGFDYQQMADLLELPLGTLKSRLFRARMALKDELKGYMSDTR